MGAVVKIAILTAMVILTVVSMWTTYESLNDSILPEPTVRIHITDSFIWDCSIFALGLSFAIGLMLFAIKVAVIDGQKRLNIVGIIGLAVIAFISISFNMDVLYRRANSDFFINFSTTRMTSVYEDYLVRAQAELGARRAELRKLVARQEGELDAEIRGLREAPEGYGRIAKQEDYQLTLLSKTTAVELEGIDEAIKKKEEADALLASAATESIDDIEKLQQELRVVIKDVAAATGIPLPPPVKMENPLFTVFAKLFDIRNVGIKEIFFLLIAIFLDLGDIIGYSLVPNKKKRTLKLITPAGPEPVSADLALPTHLQERPQLDDQSGVGGPIEITDESEELAAAQGAEGPPRPPSKRPFSFRKR